MPLYEYRCISCRSVTKLLRPAARRNEPGVCSECRMPARRIISKPQKLVEVDMTPEQIRTDPEVWR